MIIWLFSRVTIGRANVGIDDRDVYYLHTLIICFIVIRELRLYGYNVTPISEVGPPTHDAGRPDQIVLLKDLVFDMWQAQRRSYCDKVINWK